MIVCKKPITLHDVDLMGMAGLAALGLAAWWLVAAPWQQTWTNYGELAAKHRSIETQLQEDVVELERFQQGLAQLEQTLTSQAEKVPRAVSGSRLLREMTDVAKHAQLRILSVAPQPAKRDGDYVINDIQLTARGRSRDFIRFLDRLARDNPYQSLQHCSITRPAGRDEPTCELSWLVRLYLLPTDPPDRSRGRS